MTDWVLACATDDIDEEDLIRFDHEDKTYAIYNTDNGFLPPPVTAPMKCSIWKTDW
ncbi:hypothetical protein [Aliamphritea spongicola]|nr:hypothetical protein [Aliamphritea spongicola]